MTKLNWDKADEYVPDPGAMIEVPDVTRPYKHVSADEKARRRAELHELRRRQGRAIQEAELKARLAEHGWPDDRLVELGGLFRRSPADGLQLANALTWPFSRTSMLPNAARAASHLPYRP